MTRRRDTSDLLVVVDGPLAGRWYHRIDWTERYLAAQRLGWLPTQPQGTARGYRANGQHVPHPHLPGVSGAALTWRPDLPPVEIPDPLRAA